MRSCDGGLFHKFKIDIRLIVPGVDDDRAKLRNRLQQRILADDLSPCGIYEEGPRPHLCKEIPVRHSAGGFVERDVKRDNVGLGEKRIQVAEAV